MPLKMKTAATQGVGHTQTGKIPIAWTKRVNNVEQELQLGGAEPDLVNHDQDFLDAIGQSEEELNTPPMDQDVNVSNPEMAEFETPEIDAEWDMHAQLDEPSQPTEQNLFSRLPEEEAEHELFSCVAPAEAEGRVPPVASDIAITNNNLEQLNINEDIIENHNNNNNNNNSCELMSELNRPIFLEPVAPDTMMDIVADQENNLELANLNMTDTWMQDYLRSDNFLGEENFLDNFEAVINSSNDIAAFPVELEVNPEPLVPAEPEEEKPSSSNILEQAIGETLYPVDNVSIEVIEQDHAQVDEDEEWMEKPKVRKTRKVKGSRIVKKEPVVRRRTVGRPARQEPITITEIPDEAELTEEQRAALKYRRMRDLNNEASRKCRKNRKAKINNADILVEEEEAKNKKLNDIKQNMEAEIKTLKVTLAKRGLLPKDLY